MRTICFYGFCRRVCIGMSVSPTRETRYFTQKSTEMDSCDIQKFFGDYIYANGNDLFCKPYIVMLSEKLDMDWTCFISVNAGAIASGSAPDKCDCIPGNKVCGFINYDPNADDDVVPCTPLHGHNPCLFFSLWLVMCWHGKVMSVCRWTPWETF